MFKLKSIINQKTFNEQVLALVKQGTTYLDGIITVKEKYQLHDTDIPKLIDDTVLKRLEKELHNLKMININAIDMEILDNE